MIRIIESQDYSLEALSIYQSIASLQFENTESTDKLTTVLVIRLSYYIGKEFLDKYPCVRYILSPTTGFNHLDLNELNRRGIKLITLKDLEGKLSVIKSTTEHTLMLAIAINRKIGLYLHNYRLKQKCDVLCRDLYKGKELSDQNLGILGNGRIGSQLTSMAVNIWKDVKVWDINPKKIAKVDRNHVCKGPEELFEFADTLCICINYLESNTRYISRVLLDRLKIGSCIVNTSRGEVIDEKEVIQRLHSRKIFGYATDVISEEHFDRDKLIDMALDAPINLLYTPHIGGCTYEAMRKTEILIAEYFKEQECI